MERKDDLMNDSAGRFDIYEPWFGYMEEALCNGYGGFDCLGS